MGVRVRKYPVVIVGAGPAGIAAALSLRDRGVEPLVVERTDRVASSWCTRYDRLRLNTGRQFSHLPRRRFPKGTPTFPTRDQFIDHLQQHARDLKIRPGCTVHRIESRQGGWRLKTSAGDIDTRQVIVATGYEHTPYIPTWPGAQRFTGEILHSSDYRNPSRYAGKQVLVVGPGSSGMEIAHDLAVGGAAKVWLAARTPPNIIVRNGPLGLPGDAIGTPLYHLPPLIADRIARIARLRSIGDLTHYGLPIPRDGTFTRLHRSGKAPAIIDLDVIDAVRNGFVEVVKAPASIDHDSVWLSDGVQLRPQVVICATGYLCGLEPLVGHLGVLNEQGAPIADGRALAEGLRFLGFLSRPSLIGYVGKRSKRIAKEIADELNNSPKDRAGSEE